MEVLFRETAEEAREKRLANGAEDHRPPNRSIPPVNSGLHDSARFVLMGPRQFARIGKPQFTGREYVMDTSGGPAHLDENAQATLNTLMQKVQDLEDLIEELTEVALVNRAVTLALVSRNIISREELRAIYERIEIAHGQAVESEEGYRILPGAAAYFLEAD